MEDSQREAMYNAWCKKQNFVNVEVTENGGVWECKCIEKIDLKTSGEDRIQAVRRMEWSLDKHGYKIGNLPEAVGIK